MSNNLVQTVELKSICCLFIQNERKEKKKKEKALTPNQTHFYHFQSGVNTEFHSALSCGQNVAEQRCAAPIQ